MRKTIAVALIVFWLVGFLLHVAGSMIHLLFVVGMVVLLIDLFSGRRHVV